MISVSIIVPVFNSEKYLEKCILSLVNQTLKQYEIIFVDDASTDGSLIILQRYEKMYPDFIQVIHSDINQRQGGARNLGILAAKGDYIGFVDSDDWVKPEMFEKLFTEAKSKDLDIVGCNFIIKRGDNETIIKQYDICEWEESKQKLSLQEKRKILVESGSVISMIYRRKMIINNDIFFPVKMTYEDNFFVPVALFHAKSFGVVHEALYYYFQDNSESTTKKKDSTHHLDRILTSNMLRDWFSQNDLKNEFGSEIEFLYTKYNYIISTNTILAKFSKINWKELKKVRDNFISLYPEYFKNKYYIKEYTIYKRLLFRLNDIYVYAFIYKLGNFVRKVIKSGQ